MSDEEQTNQSKENPITFEYKISPSYSNYSISGAQGGINAFGQFVINLYSERLPIPKKEQYDIDTKGKLIFPPKDIQCKESIIRDVLFGITLRIENARGLAEWILRRIEDHERIQKNDEQE